MLTPEQIAAPGGEHAHQAAIFQHLATVESKRNPAFAMVFAVPNGADYGGKSSTGARMRAEGLKRGVPDMFWPWAAPQYDALLGRPCRLTWPGLWLELKRPGLRGHRDGGRSPEQVTWHMWLREQGWPVVTAYGWRSGVRALLLYERGLVAMPAGGDCLFVVEEEWPC